METIILIVFLILLFLIFLYSLAQLNLLLNYLKNKKKADSSEKYDFSKSEEIPFVTIQLPVYNEKNVIERLLRNIAEIEYPPEKLEIQVLNDSTDDSLAVTSALVHEIQQSGVDIIHIHRNHRTGFKAGALKNGLKTAKGEFIAIFDSDFLPKKDWLQRTIPYFKDEKIGVVQTRWGHLNRSYSLLTRVQAFVLDFHFILEQTGRSYGNHFINFNGTAGIWRKKCILDAGNWQGDTLTEDLDLSYRAQLKNWKFKYLEAVKTPAELPVTISAARSQQFRWNKGAAENFQKNYFKLLSSKSVSVKTKFHGFFHLLNSSLFPLVLFLAILSLPVLYIINNQFYADFVGLMAFFSLSTIIFFSCYWVTYSRNVPAGKMRFLKYIGIFFTFFSIAMGFSVHNSFAVLEGHFGKKSEFVRTPKFNITGNEKYSIQKRRFLSQFSVQLCLEIILLFYFAFAIYSAFLLSNFSLILFHLMLFFGFLFVVVKSLNVSFRFTNKNLI